MHTISLLKYLVGANLKQLVLTESNGPIVDCYITIGQWIIRTQTPEGGCPHAETLCLSILGREKADEIIVSSPPCDSFGKTPPCCYSLLASRANVLILNCNAIHQEKMKLLMSFMTVGLMNNNKLFPMPNTTVKTIADTRSYIADCKNKLTICNPPAVYTRLYATSLINNANNIIFDNGRLVTNAYHLGQSIVKVAISFDTMVNDNIYLLSNQSITYLIEDKISNNISYLNYIAIALKISLNNLIANRLIRLGIYKLINGDNIYNNLSSIEIGFILARINNP